MRVFRILRQRARSLFRGAKVDSELRRELDYHLHQLTLEKVDAGMNPQAARLAAKREMGGMSQYEDQCRDQRRIGWLTDIRKDVAYAWRMLWKAPGFTALALVTLAFGMGAGIAAYALAEGLLLRSLPFPSPERLVSVYSVHRLRGNSESVGHDNFRDWEASNTVFERMAFTEFSQTTLTGLGDAERIEGMSVSEGFFELFGVRPAMGRWFTPEEQKVGGDSVVMLSHRFWMRKLGGRPDVVGCTLILNDRLFRVSGVMPEDFRLNSGYVAEYWMPFRYRSSGRMQHQYSAYARLRPGVSIKAAQTQMSEIGRRLEAAYADNRGWGVRVAAMRVELLELFGPALRIFGAAAFIMLLVACANVASLLLARGIGRGKEIAVRIGLGAERRRVIRLLLTESLLLSSMGVAAGLLLAAWLLRLAIMVAPPWLALGRMVAVSPTLALFAVAMALGTGVLTGLWPALRGSRANLNRDLKEGGSALMTGRGQERALGGLVAAEIALAVVLLTFSGLLARSLMHLLHTDLGYRPDHLISFRMSPPASRYPNEQARMAFYDRLLAQLAALPGVVSASGATGVPLGGTYSGNMVVIEGQAPPRDWAEQTTRGSIITPDYFRTLGIGLRSGRGFSLEDTAQSEPVAVVNETFVRELLPEGNPIGRRIKPGGDKWLRVVGVVGDSRYHGPARPLESEVYVPFSQSPWLQFVVLRTGVPEQTVMGAVRKVIRDLDPALPITQVRTMQDSLEINTSLQRELAILVTAFAAITLGMAALGLGGVMAYAVSRRRREIGLRMALGARGSDVSRDVVRRAAKLISGGCAIGVLCAFAASRVLESLLYGVQPHDPMVLTAAPIVLATVAVLACLAPARRAASVDPMAALRQE